MKKIVIKVMFMILSLALSQSLFSIGFTVEYPGSDWKKHDGAGWSQPQLAKAREYMIG